VKREDLRVKISECRGRKRMKKGQSGGKGIPKLTGRPRDAKGRVMPGINKYKQAKADKRAMNREKNGGPRELSTPLLDPGVIEEIEADIQQEIETGDYFDKPMREVEAREALFMLALAKELRGRDVSELGTMELVKMAELLQKTRDSRIRLRLLIEGHADSRTEITFREGALELLSDKDFRIVEEKMVRAYEKNAQKLIEN
jgi:hypothetical protein